MKLLFYLILLIFLSPIFSYAFDSENKTDKDSNPEFLYTYKTKEGLTFRVPEDMPIETRNGITAPIPFNEYVYRKFKRVYGDLARLEKRLEKLEEISEKDRP